MFREPDTFTDFCSKGPSNACPLGNLLEIGTVKISGVTNAEQMNCDDLVPMHRLGARVAQFSN